MSTLDELIHYCTEENSFGALMLTGQWGCGKTYLVEHELPERLGDSYIMIRISLFGATSIDEIHKKVRQSYFESVVQNLDDFLKSNESNSDGGKLPVRIMSAVARKTSKASSNTKGIKAFSLMKDLVKMIPVAEKFLLLNPSDYISLVNSIGNKTVVLVFDDLERSCLDEVEVLGCINEYCENKQFKTLIIANEEKMLGSFPEINDAEEVEKPQTAVHSTGISYKEIKEKIVSRTIGCQPDYEGITSKILSNYLDKEGNYKEFLVANYSAIIGVFMAGESRNIRTLKCAIQDFKRVYSVIQKYEEFNSSLVKYMQSFIAYISCYKKGCIEKSERYGFILADSEVKNLYPLHYSEGSMLNSVKDWIVTGEWNVQEVIIEIDHVIESRRNPDPEELVRCNSLISLDEQIIETGFPKVIEAAYAGKLTIDDYITLLMNVLWARQVSFTLPIDLDMERVKTGVIVCLKSLEDSDEPKARSRMSISAESENLLTDIEKEIYRTISQFRNDNVQMFAKNRRMFLVALSEQNVEGLYECINKQFRIFDSDMAQSIADQYLLFTNAQCQDFNYLFERMWENCYSSLDLQKDESILGFEKLKVALNEIRDTELKNNKQIKAAICMELIQSVNRTIESIKTHQ